MSDFRERVSAVFSSQWTHVAVPVTGHGRAVDRIVVEESHTSNRGSKYAFAAGIYASSQKGLPGKLIARASGKASSKCGLVTISIAPTTLQRTTTYWVEEKVHRRGEKVHKRGGQVRLGSRSKDEAQSLCAAPPLQFLCRIFAFQFDNSMDGAIDGALGPTEVS